MFKVEKQDSITIFFLNASGFCQQWWLETSLFVVNLGYKILPRWELVVQYVKFVSPVLWQTKYYTKQTGSISSCLIEAFISFLECMAKRHENNRTNTFFYIRSVDVKVKRFLWHCKMAWSFFSSGNNIPNSGDEWVNSWRGSPFLYLLKNVRKPEFL